MFILRIICFLPAHLFIDFRWFDQPQISYIHSVVHIRHKRSLPLIIKICHQLRHVKQDTYSSQTPKTVLTARNLRIESQADHNVFWLIFNYLTFIPLISCLSYYTTQVKFSLGVIVNEHALFVVQTQLESKRSQLRQKNCPPHQLIETVSRRRKL